MFFTAGNRNPYLYELRCEAWRFSHEKVDTGVDEIDDLMGLFTHPIRLTLDHAGEGKFLSWGGSVYWFFL